MPQENVEIVRAAYAAFNRRDWDQVFSEADPEIELTVEVLPDDPGTRRGRKAVQARLEEALAVWDAWSYELDDLRESGEQVVALLRIRARPKGTTADIENRVGHVWTLRDGKVVSIHLFPSREQAFEAAGAVGIAAFGR
jgi:ketosteroid isomerase-like protein